MAVGAGFSKIATSGSVFIYDTGDSINSYQGEPTTNYVPSPYNYSLYAYASGPVDVSTLDQNGNAITAKRYTITNAVNVARAAIFPVTTTNTYYTFSFKWRYNGSTTATPSVTVSAAKGNPETNNNTFNSQVATTTSIGNGWYFTTYTFNFATNPTGGCILTFGIDTGSTASYVNETFDIYQAQFEVKSHATPWANGTRSNTQGLLDISGGGNSINLANMSFDASAQMVFDGTDDYISIPNSTSFGNFTAEVVIKPTSYPGNAAAAICTEYPGSNYTVNFNIGFDGSQFMGGFYNNSSGGWHQIFTSLPTLNVYAHYTLTYNGAQMIFYKNGSVINTLNTTDIAAGGNPIRIGRRWDIGDYFPGYIDVAKVYNRALSAAEVLTNFNHYKTRFNIT